MCGCGPVFELDKQGRQLCRGCAAKAVVSELDAELLAAGTIRRCPHCGPTMRGTDTVTVDPLGVQHVTISGKWQCGKCGLTVSIFPVGPATVRAVLVAVLLGLNVAVALSLIPKVPRVALYILVPLFLTFGIVALVDFVQRCRYPVVRE